MTPDDQQSPDSQFSDQSQSKRISRDTLLLLGALSFLILAVALTFLFTPGGQPGDEAGVPTEELTTTPDPAYPVVSPTPDQGAYPSPGQPTAPVAGFDPAYPYPMPVVPTGDPALETTATPDAAVGVDPPSLIPTDAAYPGPDLEEPTPLAGYPGPAGGQPTPLPGYPGPTGEGTPPPMPTLALTPIVPTAVPPPPVVQPTVVRPTVVQPTAAPPPTAIIPPTSEPFPPGEVTATPESPVDPPAPTALPLPTETPGPPPPPPFDVVSGNVRWSRAESPIVLERDLQVAPGSELVIEPGVEVRLAPGVSIFVDGGQLLALGQPNQPVRFVGATGARWSGIFGQPNSFVVLEHTEVRGGGLGGTVMALERSELAVRASRFTDNGGAILLTDTRLEMRDSEVTGNDMPFGPALEASFGRGNFVTLSNNRFGGNRLSEGAPQVRLSNRSTFETLNLAIEGNLIRGGAPNLQLTTNGPLVGTVGCNALIGDAQGFGLRTQTPQVDPNGVPPMRLRVENNYIDEHVPPIIPVYLRYGLGRGATSEVLLDMRNNWWGSETGPYEPEANPLGRGDSVGVNILYAPWLTAPPSCVPSQ
ncbi:hypothetical protein [Candidatus Chloroploca sp. Khr17]|uniref:hypothetical protein n=1 Tax=Candidatus Chloroploca sp. Khr17 TaxID=2496869 RepID=UPI0013EBB89A|nr:hypothetical protein [Candidatus Chloroploca sp. Khr17]